MYLLGLVHGLITAGQTIMSTTVLILVALFVFSCMAVELIAKDWRGLERSCQAVEQSQETFVCFLRGRPPQWNCPDTGDHQIVVWPMYFLVWAMLCEVVMFRRESGKPKVMQQRELEKRWRTTDENWEDVAKERNPKHKSSPFPRSAIKAEVFGAVRFSNAKAFQRDWAIHCDINAICHCGLCSSDLLSPHHQPAISLFWPQIWQLRLLSSHWQSRHLRCLRPVLSRDHCGGFNWIDESCYGRCVGEAWLQNAMTMWQSPLFERFFKRQIVEECDGICSSRGRRRTEFTQKQGQRGGWIRSDQRSIQSHLCWEEVPLPKVDSS